MEKFNVQDLVDSGLVRKKNYDNGLSVLKYHNKVFWKSLWDTDERLLDCRGTVVDSDWNIVTMPFTKVFNLGENGTTLPNKPLVGVRKVNGFMASLSVYDNSLVVSTTGTLDSDFVKLAQKHIGVPGISYGLTYLFEICDSSDPHIVEEEEGAYLIGCRPNYIGSHLFSEAQLDFLAEKYGFKRPEWKVYKDPAELPEDVSSCEHEGYMIRCSETMETICKIKSPHYLAKKFFMRMSEKKIEMIYQDNLENLKMMIDEEYYPLFEYVKSLDKDYWLRLNDQQRRELIEEYLECQH